VDLPEYDPRYVQAERIERGRKTKGNEAFDRYIEASNRYLMENPDAPITSYEDWLKDRAMANQRQEFYTQASGGKISGKSLSPVKSSLLDYLYEKLLK
jgi:hypothetical protein